VSEDISDFQTFYQELKDLPKNDSDHKVDVLVLMIEELIRENENGLIFSLLSNMNQTSLDSSSVEQKKNFTEFDLEKVENVILGQMFQRIISNDR
jgi:hypothetical protein